LRVHSKQPEAAVYSPLTVVYTPKCFIPHMALLRQSCLHCAKFPTAASRRSLGRISVPMCPYTLSGRIPIVALVGRYPANKLMGRKVILKCPKAFEKRRCRLHHYAVLAIRWDSYSPLQGRFLTCYSPVRRSVLLPRSTCMYEARHQRSF
jgi:hypothetical protein